MPTIDETRIRWVHTGIDAPLTFTITGVNEVQTNRGVAYSTELVHPSLGVVGRIANEGCGGPTTFDPYDHTRFGERELQELLERSLQDGEPMKTDNWGLETLLDEIIYEAETTQLVTEMRARDRFLIRSYLSREAASWGPSRGAPGTYDRIVTQRAGRERLAAALAADPAETLVEGAYWQMFTGEDWAPLIGTPSLTSAQVTDRLRHLDRLAAELDEPDTYNTAVPFGDELHLFGVPTATFLLVGDHVGTVDSTRWCTCRSRRSVVPFERWSSRSLTESGTVHAAIRCRRLVRLD